MESNEAAERYRKATEDLFQQLDWCIGYLHGIRKGNVASVLAKNRSHIRTEILKQAEEPLPSKSSAG